MRKSNPNCRLKEISSQEAYIVGGGHRPWWQKSCNDGGASAASVQKSIARDHVEPSTSSDEPIRKCAICGKIFKDNTRFLWIRCDGCKCWLERRCDPSLKGRGASSPAQGQMTHTNHTPMNYKYCLVCACQGMASPLQSKLSPQISCATGLGVPI